MKNALKVRFIAWGDPVCKIIDRSAVSILDVGCGEGDPMRLIRAIMKPKYCVGVDLFEKSIKKAKKDKLHDRYLICDVRKMRFPRKSFDVVLASHVIEHLPKKDTRNFIKSLEKIAKKQVIIATPIGEMYHPPVDGNKLQLHLSAFYPDDLKSLGYETINYGRKSVLGENGLVHRTKSDFLKKIIYFVNILVSPMYYINDRFADYIFVAYKRVHA